MNTTQDIFYYNGTGVTFKNKDGITYVNATEIAKHFGKQPSDWTRLKSTDDFLNALEGLRKIPRGVMYQVVNDGVNNGTWMHEDVALEFSRWLSPAFAIWCNDRIKELLQHGITASQPTIENIIENPEFGIELLSKLKKEREEKAKLYADLEIKNKTIEIQENQLKVQAPVVQYAKEVLSSDSLIATTVIAKDMGFTSARAFNRELIDRGILNRKKVNGCYVLNAKYSGKGYTHTKTHKYVDSHGHDQTTRLLYWTEKGRMFLEYMFSL